MCVHMCARVQACGYMTVHMCVCVCIGVCSCVCVCMHVHGGTWNGMCVHVHVCVSAHVGGVCAHVCVLAAGMTESAGREDFPLDARTESCMLHRLQICT